MKRNSSGFLFYVYRMKNLVFFLFLFSSSIYSQKKVFTISGIASECDQQKPIPKMPVKLIAEDGFTKEIITDSTGHYSFNITPSKLPYFCIIFPNSTLSKDKLFGFSSGQIKFRLTDTSSLKRTENFCEKSFNEKLENIMIPDIHFKKNSTDFSNEEEHSLNQVINIMKKHPASTYQLSGWLTEDANMDSLYYKRAYLIKQKIIKAGIEPDRIVVDQNPRPGFSESIEVPSVNDNLFFTLLNQTYKGVEKKK